MLIFKYYFQDSDGMILRPGRGSILPKLGLESPTVSVKSQPPKWLQ